MKKLLASLLSLALLLTMFPVSVAEASQASAEQSVSAVAPVEVPVAQEDTAVTVSEEPKITLSYPTASFEGAIIYNVYFTVSNMDGVAPEDMGLITFDTRQVDGTMDDAVEVVPGVANQGSQYMAHTNGIPAKNLGDVVYMKVYARLADGSYVYSSIVGYNMMVYANTVLEKSQDENMKALVIQTLHYGAAAQMFFNYKTDDLMNKCIPPNEHTYEDAWIVETPATLTQEGVEYRYCTACGKGKQTQAIPMLTVEQIAVTTPANKLSYYTNEVFDPAGMVVTAFISDGTTMVVTDYQVAQKVLTAEDAWVTITYGDLSAELAITVSATPLVGVAQLAQQETGSSLLVEGYFVGVAEEGLSSDKELLLKDLSSDAIIAVRDVTYGTFPDYGYQVGDRIRLLATLELDGTVNTPNKMYLQFGADNGAIADTIVSRDNKVEYALTDTIKVSSWAEMQELFKTGVIQEYSYIEITGPVYINRYAGSDGVDVSRIHLNAAATGVSGIRTDGTKTVSLRDNVMAANLGDGWSKLFFDEFPATGSYPGMELSGQLIGVYTGGNNYYYQLTVLDSDWVQLQEYDNADVICEVADAFYRQGTQIQYDQTQSRRNINASPEDATPYRTLYMDCSSFTNAVYMESFGVGVMDSTKMPSTANYTSYAVEGLGTREDVIGYWENADYTTASQISEILSQVRGQLQVGDLLVYRHGETSGSSGHVYIYLGEDMFIHCTGSSYVYNDTPETSYDKGTTAEKTGGAVQLIAADEIFVNTSSTRYLFKVTSSDSVYNFALLRPLNRGLTPTRETEDRMALRGVDIEKTVDAGGYGAVQAGQTLTYTVTLTNHTAQDQTQVELREVLATGLSFRSGSDGVTADGPIVSWVGTVAAESTVTVTYTVVVGSDAGAVVESSGTLVGGIGINDLTNTVSSYADSALTAVANQAGAYVGQTFGDPIQLVQALYPEVVDGYATVQEALADLIDSANKTCFTSTELSKLLVPDLYGGLDIRSGFTSDNRRIRLVIEEHLEVGDVILAEYGSTSVVFVYTGNGRLVTVTGTNGKCASATITGDAFTSNNILVTLIAYDRFAIVRPSMA